MQPGALQTLALAQHEQGHSDLACALSSVQDAVQLISVDSLRAFIRDRGIHALHCSSIADRPLRAQVHPDKCSHPHATSAFEVLGHANQQLQSEEVMHELRHVLTLARGAPNLDLNLNLTPAPSWLLCFKPRSASRQHGIFASPQQSGHLHSVRCMLHAAYVIAEGPHAACYGPCGSADLAAESGFMLGCDSLPPARWDVACRGRRRFAARTADCRRRRLTSDARVSRP